MNSAKSYLKGDMSHLHTALLEQVMVLQTGVR